MINNLSIAVHGFARRILMSISVDETLLPRYVNLSTNFRESPFRVDMSLSWFKHMYLVLSAFTSRPMPPAASPYYAIEFLPSIGHDKSTIWMHYMDAKKRIEKKARLELHKNAKQILEIAVVESPTSYLKTHPNKTNKTCGALLEKQGRTPKWRSPMDAFIWRCQCWPTNKNLPSTPLYEHRM